MTTKAEQADGILERTDDRDVLRYERRLAQPVERVWRAITEPDEIVRWLAEAELEPREGGKVVLRWLNMPEENPVARGTVTAFDPPWTLELDTDIHGVLRFELTEDDGGCRLSFTASYPALDDESSLSVLAGWHIHLDHLVDALVGRAQDWPRWKEEQLPRWQEHHDRYASRSFRV
jgi:uncharacterized protein YndB with AHSA1/START domain